MASGLRECRTCDSGCSALLMGSLLLLATLLSGVDPAKGWSLATDHSTFCVVERRDTEKVIAIRYDALEERSSVLLANAPGKRIAWPAEAKIELMLWRGDRYLKSLRGFSGRPVQFKSGSQGILLESETKDYLSRMVEADRLTVSVSSTLLAYMDAPDLGKAITILHECSRRAKRNLLDSL